MEIALVMVILVVTVVLFATEQIPIDVVAILILAALVLLKLLTPEEGISGFSNPATVTVAAMFVLSAGLRKTGAVAAFGRALIRLGKNSSILLILIMLTVGVVSAFINNTAAVAVFLPMVLAAGAAHKVSSSKLLIPLSFASQFGGVCTLIGTSTNLLVSSISERSGHGAFGMFEFAKMGMILFGAGTLYFLIVGRWLLPGRRGDQLLETYQLADYITELRVMPDSSLVGKTIRETRLGEKHDVRIIEILRDQRKIWSRLDAPIAEGDVLLVRGKVKDFMDLKDRYKLAIEPEFQLKDEALQDEDLSLVEAVVAPLSRVSRRTLAELDFHRRYNLMALAIQRRGHPLREKLREVRLRFGDTLLLLGPRRDIARLRADENFIVLEEREEPAPRKSKAPLALAIIAGAVALAALNVLPIVITALLGCVMMIVTRVITVEDAYGAVDWKVIILLGGILPLGIAMQKTGAARLLAETAVNVVGALGPTACLAIIYLLTAALTECMSNNAAAVLLAPIAISTAVNLDCDPRPFLMAVTFAASTSFATPVGYQTNTMVYNAGGYQFKDFMKVGIPLNLIFWGLAVYFIPKFWPF